MSSKRHTCELCGIDASKKCDGCLSAWYCCKEHQVTHWKQHHKVQCKKKKVPQNWPTYSPRTLLQKLHTFCKWKNVFTEIYLVVEVSESQSVAIQEALCLSVAFADVFLCKSEHRIIIASKSEQLHRSIWFKICPTIRRNLPSPFSFEHSFKTRYYFHELLYSNGFISSKGVTFCDAHKTIKNSEISELFQKVPYAFKESYHELVVFGYCRETEPNCPGAIASICLSYYQCKEEFSMCATNISIVDKIKIVAKTTRWCGAFGTVSIDSSSNKHYQWIIHIEKMEGDISIGVTSNRHHTLFVNDVYDDKNPKYVYSCAGSVTNWRKKGKTYPFVEDDCIIMDFDCAAQQFSCSINGKYQGCLIENVICGPIYYLGILLGKCNDCVSIRRFTWWEA